jgi:RNA polymerase sigma-70 factor (ECF subfamily)
MMMANAQACCYVFHLARTGHKALQLSEMTAPGEMQTDECLVKAALSGDDEAFTELVRRHKRKVFSIVARFVRNAHELDDVCQETFIKVYQSLRNYRGDAPFEHWVSKIAVNASYDALRRQRRRQVEVPLEDVAFSLSEPASSSGNPSWQESWEVLRRALEALRPEDRLVITLLNLEEKSVREISELTGWSEAKVKVRAFRARKELKRIMEDGHGK